MRCAAYDLGYRCGYRQSIAGGNSIIRDVLAARPTHDERAALVSVYRKVHQRRTRTESLPTLVEQRLVFRQFEVVPCSYYLNYLVTQDVDHRVSEAAPENVTVRPRCNQR